MRRLYDIAQPAVTLATFYNALEEFRTGAPENIDIVPTMENGTYLALKSSIADTAINGSKEDIAMLETVMDCICDRTRIDERIAPGHVEFEWDYETESEE